MLQILPDRLLQLPRRAVRASPDLLFGERGKPTLDLVDPRCRGRGEVNVKPRMTGEPGLDGRCLVRAIVVHHQMNVQIGGDVGFDGAQEFQKFAAAMTPGLYSARVKRLYFKCVCRML